MNRTPPLATILVIGLAVSAAVFAQTPAPAAPASAPPAPQSPAPAAAPAPAPTAPPAAAAATDRAKIAWYGQKFAGRRTASGERYNPNAMTMAHKSLPFGTIVEVTNLANGRKVKLRVNDRGPTQPDRAGDVSLAAARALRMTRAGIVDASIVVVSEPKAKKR